MHGRKRISPRPRRGPARGRVSPRMAPPASPSAILEIPEGDGDGAGSGSIHIDPRLVQQAKAGGKRAPRGARMQREGSRRLSFAGLKQGAGRFGRAMKTVRKSIFGAFGATKINKMPDLSGPKPMGGSKPGGLLKPTFGAMATDISSLPEAAKQKQEILKLRWEVEGLKQKLKKYTKEQKRADYEKLTAVAAQRRANAKLLGAKAATSSRTAKAAAKKAKEAAGIIEKPPDFHLNPGSREAPLWRYQYPYPWSLGPFPNCSGKAPWPIVWNKEGNYVALAPESKQKVIIRDNLSDHDFDQIEVSHGTRVCEYLEWSDRGKYLAILPHSSDCIMIYNMEDKKLKTIYPETTAFEADMETNKGGFMSRFGRTGTLKGRGTQKGGPGPIGALLGSTKSGTSSVRSTKSSKSDDKWKPFNAQPRVEAIGLTTHQHRIFTKAVLLWQGRGSHFRERDLAAEKRKLGKIMANRRMDHRKKIAAIGWMKLRAVVFSGILTASGAGLHSRISCIRWSKTNTAGANEMLIAMASGLSIVYNHNNGSQRVVSPDTIAVRGDPITNAEWASHQQLVYAGHVSPHVNLVDENGDHQTFRVEYEIRQLKCSGIRDDWICANLAGKALWFMSMTPRGGQDMAEYEKARASWLRNHKTKSGVSKLRGLEPEHDHAEPIMPKVENNRRIAELCFPAVYGEIVDVEFYRDGFYMALIAFQNGYVAAVLVDPNDMQHGCGREIHHFRVTHREITKIVIQQKKNKFAALTTDAVHIVDMTTRDWRIQDSFFFDTIIEGEPMFIDWSHDGEVISVSTDLGLIMNYGMSDTERPVEGTTDKVDEWAEEAALDDIEAKRRKLEREFARDAREAEMNMIDDNTRAEARSAIDAAMGKTKEKKKSMHLGGGSAFGGGSGRATALASLTRGPVEDNTPFGKSRSSPGGRPVAGLGPRARQLGALGSSGMNGSPGGRRRPRPAPVRTTRSPSPQDANIDDLLAQAYPDLTASTRQRKRPEFEASRKKKFGRGIGARRGPPSPMAMYDEPADSSVADLMQSAGYDQTIPEVEMLPSSPLTPSDNGWGD